MRQKLTWIIPGILVTLLLGLLWAIPAFGATAGTVDFKDKGGDAIDYVSLNGVGGSAANAITVTVTDPDLDPVLKRTPANNNLFCVESDDESYVECPTLGTFTTNPNFPTLDNFDPDVNLGNATDEDWHNLQDMGSDGVDNRDIKGYVIRQREFDAQDRESGVDSAYQAPTTKWIIQADEVSGATFYYDGTNGRLQLDEVANDGTINAIGYFIKKKTVIGARNGTSQRASVEFNTGIADSHQTSVPLPTSGDGRNTTATSNVPSFALVHTSATANENNWLDILETVVPDIKTRTVRADDGNTGNVNEQEVDLEKIAKDIRPYFKAYNTKDKSETDLRILVTSYTPDTVDNPDTPANEGTPADESRITITVNDVQNSAGGKANCVGNVGAILTHTTATPPVAIPLADQVCATTAVASTVTLEFGYKGSADTVYSTSGRIGPKSEVGRVTVDSNAMSTPMSIILQESGAATGAFSAKLMVCESGKPGCIARQAGEADEGDVQDPASRMITVPVDNAQGEAVVITYADADPTAPRTASISLDAIGPVFSDLAPASGTAGREDEPTVSFQVIDAESGLSSKDTDTDTIRVLAAVYNLDGVWQDEEEYMRNDVNPKAANNGYMASVTLEEGSRTGELDAGSLSQYEIHWWAIAVDEAGNTNVSDQDSGTKCDLKGVTLTAIGLNGTIDDMETDDKSDDVGCEPHKIRVDAAAPMITEAATGKYLDGDDEKSNKATSVVAVFNENLDCDSVSADDFTVAGSAPNGVTCKGKKVYLDVDELASDAKPKVVVATGSLTDKAGNAIGGTDASRTQTAKDGLAPNLTVTVTGTGEGTRPVTKGKVTVAVTSDERLTGSPDVVIMMVGDDYELTGTDKGSNANPTGTTNEWSKEYTVSDAGVYNVYVTGEDRSADSATGTKGMMALGTKDKFADSKTILFEVDNTLDKPVFTPSNNGKTDNPDIFIKIDFANEGKEYTIATGTGDSAATVDVDSHGTVDITSAMFDGADVTDDVTSRDNILHVYRPGNLSLGDHKLEIEVSDNAGNEKKGTNKFTLNFTVTERQPWKLDINPGANLISFPADPVDGDVNAVFSEEDITTVVTYDNASGLWMTASGTGGSLSGDLMTIDADHAYWVVSNGVLTLDVMLVASGGISVTPAAIPVVQGWNLVPVSDVAQSDAGTGIDPAAYFGNIDADVAYGYDSQMGTMVRIDIADKPTPDDATDDEVLVGSGYWVYANKAGVIIP